jgi:hypothetical protein
MHSRGLSFQWLALLIGADKTHDISGSCSAKLLLTQRTGAIHRGVTLSMISEVFFKSNCVMGASLLVGLGINPTSRMMRASFLKKQTGWMQRGNIVNTWARNFDHQKLPHQARHVY